MKNIEEFVKNAFAKIDTMDAAETVSVMSEDCAFVFANMPAVVGRKKIQEFLAAFFDSIGAIHHDILGVFQDRENVISQVRVVYTRKDGSTLTCPAATIWNMHAEKIRDYRIYVDASALFGIQ